MTFANAIQILEPYFGSHEKSHADFVIAVIGNFITDECPELAILESDPKYVDKIFRGERPLSRDDAKHIIGNQNRAGLAAYFEEHYFDCSDDSSCFLLNSSEISDIKMTRPLKGLSKPPLILLGMPSFPKQSSLKSAAFPRIIPMRQLLRLNVQFHLFLFRRSCLHRMKYNRKSTNILRHSIVPMPMRKDSMLWMPTAFSLLPSILKI